MQQHVEEFFDVLHALVYYRLGLRELAKGRDLDSGKAVAAEDAQGAVQQLARFDAELSVCMEKLQGHSYLSALARPIRQYQIDHEVRMLKAALMDRMADPVGFERNFATLFPTTIYHLTPDLDRLRAAMDAVDVKEPLGRRRPALDLAATRAVSHLRGHTVRVRTIKEAQTATAQVRSAAGTEPPPIRNEAEWEVFLNGEPAKHIEWGDLLGRKGRK